MRRAGSSLDKREIIGFKLREMRSCFYNSRIKFFVMCYKSFNRNMISPAPSHLSTSSTTTKELEGL